MIAYGIITRSSSSKHREESRMRDHVRPPTPMLPSTTFLPESAKATNRVNSSSPHTVIAFSSPIRLTNLTSWAEKAFSKSWGSNFRPSFSSISTDSVYSTIQRGTPPR
eukprot:Lithocolla_globosa_v1_NODE_1577_length_2471_cov_446.691639.p2 type:complete len:108 gc:universal NODE_1577_length_2471_cov_446.691639:1398-1075(-)